MTPAEPREVVLDVPALQVGPPRLEQRGPVDLAACDGHAVAVGCVVCVDLLDALDQIEVRAHLGGRIAVVARVVESKPGRLRLARLDHHKDVARESGLFVHERAVGAIRLQPLFHPHLGVIRLDGDAVHGGMGCEMRHPVRP